MRPKKELIERARRDGAIERMQLLLSAAYLLNSEANVLMDEAQELMERYGLMVGELRRGHTLMAKAAGRYFKEFSSMVTEGEKVRDYFADLEAFDEWFRKWAKVPADREPVKGEGEA